MKNLRTKVLSAVLAVSVLGASAVAFTGIMLDVLGISTDRIYVSYMTTDNWGWNGSNF